LVQTLLVELEEEVLETLTELQIQVEVVEEIKIMLPMVVQEL
jgi:hypothetical protein